MTPELVNLPWQIQLALASGYAAYLLACVGRREGHKAIDTAFMTLVFGLFATGALYLLRDWPPIIAGLSALIGTCGAAVLWRMRGRDWLRWLLRRWNVSWTTDDPNALAVLVGNTRHSVSQIAVLMDDGTWLRCDRAEEFANSPFGPFLIGHSGDVAMYLTHEDCPGKDDRELKSVKDPDYGDLITYIPANRIRMINIRHLPGLNRSSKGEVSAGS